jgi:hypothetical protein
MKNSSTRPGTARRPIVEYTFARGSVLAAIESLSKKRSKK